VREHGRVVALVGAGPEEDVRASGRGGPRGSREPPPRRERREGRRGGGGRGRGARLRAAAVAREGPAGHARHRASRDERSGYRGVASRAGWSLVSRPRAKEQKVVADEGSVPCMSQSATRHAAGSFRCAALPGGPQTSPCSKGRGKTSLDPGTRRKPKFAVGHSKSLGSAVDPRRDYHPGYFSRHRGEHSCKAPSRADFRPAGNSPAPGGRFSRAPARGPPPSTGKPFSAPLRGRFGGHRCC